MKRSLAVAIIVSAFMCSSGGRIANAQLSLADAACRKSIGRGVRTFASTLLQEIGKCHRRRMLGRVASGIDCNNADDPRFPGATRLARAKAHLVTTIENGCRATTTSPQGNGYRICSDPCGANVITSDYASVAACLSCLTESAVESTTAGAFGTPPTATAPFVQERCQTGVGVSLRRYSLARMAEQQKCAFNGDRNPTAVDCKTADTSGHVAEALASAQKLLASMCQDEIVAALDSCGATLGTEQACIQGLADACTDFLFNRVYRGSMGTPTPTGTVTGAPATTTTSAASTPTVPSLTPTWTPTLAPTPMDCGADAPRLDPVISPTTELTQVVTGTVFAPGPYMYISVCGGAGCDSVTLPFSHALWYPLSLTVPLHVDVVNHLEACSWNTFCGNLACTRTDANGQPLDIVQSLPTGTPTPTNATPSPTGTPPTGTPTPSYTPSCAPTGTPYCADTCNPCPTIRANCPAYACGLCVQNPDSCPSGRVRWCLPYNNCCQCGTPTPTPLATPLTPTMTPTSCRGDLPVVEPVTSPTDLLQQVINVCGRNGGSSTLSVWGPGGSAPTPTFGHCTLPCNLGNASCYAFTVPLLPNQPNPITVCQNNFSCPAGGCVTTDGNGAPLLIVQGALASPSPTGTEAPSATPTITGTPTPTAPGPTAITTLTLTPTPSWTWAPTHTPGPGVFAYVSGFDPQSSLDGVAVIDVSTNSIATIIGSQTLSTGHNYGIAVSPDGTRVYVTRAGNVAIIDALSRTMVASVPVGTTPGSLAVTPNGRFVYVANRADSISVIDTASNTVTATISLPAQTAPLGLAITPDGSQAYVGVFGGRSVLVIDTASNNVTTSVAVEPRPSSLAANPNGGFVYVAGFDTMNMSVVDTVSNSAVATAPVDGNIEVAVTPDGTRAYLAGGHNVAVVDTTSYAMLATIANVGVLGAVAITPDGSSAYVTNPFSYDVSVISTATNTLTTTIPLPIYVRRIAIGTVS